jgi:hypothetical protein
VAKTSEPTSALVRAAQELETELSRCEEAAAEAAKIRLSTEKNIGRAARALRTAGEHRGRAGPQGERAPRRDPGRAQPRRVGRRPDGDAGGRDPGADGAAPGAQARATEIAVSVRELTEFARQAKTPGEIVERLGPIEERVAQAHQEARADDFDDVAHDIAGFRELLATMRRKLEGK